MPRHWRLPGLLALAVGLACVGSPAAGAAIPTVPWGSGCIPTAVGAVRTSGNCGAELVEGRAVAPPNAPAVVKATIAAANRIVNRPYVWGGGHLAWASHGYDCSGAVGYALHGGALLDQTMVSGQLESWGVGGVGRWITVYANSEHVYMVVAGLRFDTREDPPGVSGPRWHMARVEPPGFVARHPAGL